MERQCLSLPLLSLAFLDCCVVSSPTMVKDIPGSGLRIVYIVGSTRPVLSWLHGWWTLTEADRAFLDFAQVAGTRGQLGGTAPRTAGEACRPVCAAASPFPTKVWSARESWRKAGCAIGRHAIVSGGMFPCTRVSSSLFPEGAWPHHQKYKGCSRGTAVMGCVGALSPEQHAGSAVHGPALPCLSCRHACTQA